MSWGVIRANDKVLSTPEKVWKDVKFGGLSFVIKTHWSQDKMAAIFTGDTFKCIFNENMWISIKNSLTFVPKGPD